MKPRIIQIERGVIDNGPDDPEALSDVQASLERNRGECELGIAVMTKQLLDIVNRNLRSAHVFEAVQPNGEVLIFVGRLPYGVTFQSFKAHVEKKYA